MVSAEPRYAGSQRHSRRWTILLLGTRKFQFRSISGNKAGQSSDMTVGTIQSSLALRVCVHAQSRMHKLHPKTLTMDNKQARQKHYSAHCQGDEGNPQAAGVRPPSTWPLRCLLSALSPAAYHSTSVPIHFHPSFADSWQAPARRSWWKTQIQMGARQEFRGGDGDSPSPAILNTQRRATSCRSPFMFVILVSLTWILT